MALIGTAAALLLPSASYGQGRDLEGARPIKARVHITTATIAGDTTTLGYTVENLRTGDEDLTAFLVAVTAPVIRMPSPTRGQWYTDPRYRRRAIALWDIDGSELLHPGESTPELFLVARGLPDLVTYWAKPDLTAHPVDIDEDPNRVPTFIYSDTGTTVGVSPIPSVSTPAALVSRLRVLAARTCGPLRWISNADVCRRLDVALLHARKALGAASNALARIALEEFVHELDVQHGSHVSDEAYALLRPNATYLLGRL